MNFKDDVVLQCQKVGQVYQKNVCDSARIELYILVEQCLSLWHSLCGRGGHGVSLLGAVEKVENKRSRGKKLMFFIKIIKTGQ